MVRKLWKVYGVDDHKQRESFNKSYLYNFSYDNVTRVIVIYNSDKTGTNDYSIIKIIRDTAEECDHELLAQIADGIFENSRVGKVEEISADEFRNILNCRK